MDNETKENLIEGAYRNFAKIKQGGSGQVMSEREAFKHVVRNLLAQAEAAQ